MAAILSDYKRALQAANKNVRAMLLYYLGCAFANGIYGVLFNLYFLKAGFDERFLGTFMLVQSISLAICVLPVGVFADRADKSRLVKLAYLVMNLVTTMFFLVKRATVLVALASLQSIGTALAVGSEFPFLIENTDKEDRTHVIALMSMTFTVMPILGTLLGGYLPAITAKLAGLGAESAASYRLAMIITMVFFWLAGLPLLWVSRTASGAEARPAEKKLSLNLRSEKRVVWGMTAYVGFVGLAASLFVPYGNVLLSQRYSMPAHVIGWVFTAQNAVMALGTLVIPRVGERFGNLRAIKVLQGACLPLVVLMAFTGSKQLFVAAFVLRAALMNMGAPLIDSSYMDKIEPSERATANALTTLSRNFMWGVGGKIGGGFLREKKYSTPLLMAAFFYLAALLSVNYALKDSGATERDDCLDLREAPAE